MIPALSIVIPTKNRYETLFPVVEALLKYIEGSDYEIVIQDNSDCNQFAIDKVKLIDDSKVKYFYSPMQMSVSENSSLAISKSSGQYITFIGDDDMVSPYILKIVASMISSGTDCLTFSCGHFYWKDLIFNKKYLFHYPSTLQYPRHISLEIEILSSEVELKKVLQTGGTKIGGLPRLYHGIVKKEILEQVRMKFGSYVPGSSPDMALAVALSCVVGQYGYVNYPVTVTGNSKNSAGGMGLRGAHVAKIEDVSWLPLNTIETWDNNIPRIWTGSTIYAQNIHEVLQKAGVASLVNYENLYSHMYIKEIATRSIVKPYLTSINKTWNGKFVYLMTTYCKGFLYKLFQDLPDWLLDFSIILRGDLYNRTQIRNIDSIDMCMRTLLKNTKI